jgi:hypothetical protein
MLVFDTSQVHADVFDGRNLLFVVLNDEEKVAAIEHVRVNLTGVENKHFKPYQLGELLDNGGALLREPECRNDDAREVGHSTVVDHSQESDSWL